MQFQRFDSFQKIDKNVYFNSHFILLNNYLITTKLIIEATLIYKQNNNILLINLRNLEDSKKIECVQYENSFVSYFVNYKCSFTVDNDLELVSIKPNKMEIINNNININNKEIKTIEFKNEEFKLNDFEKTALENQYKDYYFNKIEITKISNIKIKNELSFNIIGDFDKKLQNENTYNILLKNKDNKEIIATCSVTKTEIENEISISCFSPKNEINEKSDTLKIEQGMYVGTMNKEVLIVNNKNNVDVNFSKEGLSAGAIIGITIAGIIVVIPFVFYLVKYCINEKDNNYENEDNENNGIRPPNGDNSRDIIFNHNY